MRAFLALLLLAATAFAGCAADDTEDPAGGGTGDGAGGGGDGAGGDGGGDGGDGGDGDGGADGDGGRIDPGAGGGDQAWARDTHPDFPGLVLEGTLDPFDASGSAVATVAARNEGEATYMVSSICVDAWGEAMRRGSEAVLHREPMAHCDAFGLREFEDEARTFEWNRTLWDDASGGYAPAPDGEYVWAITFRVYKGDPEDYEPLDAADLAVEFTVLV